MSLKANIVLERFEDRHLLLRIDCVCTINGSTQYFKHMKCLPNRFTTNNNKMMVKGGVLNVKAQMESNISMHKRRHKYNDL